MGQVCSNLFGTEQHEANLPQNGQNNIISEPAHHPTDQNTPTFAKGGRGNFNMLTGNESPEKNFETSQEKIEDPNSTESIDKSKSPIMEIYQPKKITGSRQTDYSEYNKPEKLKKINFLQ